MSLLSAGICSVHTAAAVSRIPRPQQSLSGCTPPSAVCYRLHPALSSLLQAAPRPQQSLTGSTPPSTVSYRLHPALNSLLQAAPCPQQSLTGCTPPSTVSHRLHPTLNCLLQAAPRPQLSLTGCTPPSTVSYRLHRANEGRRLSLFHRFIESSLSVRYGALQRHYLRVDDLSTKLGANERIG